MNQPIYFPKIGFCESIGYGHRNSIVLLNLMQQELFYPFFHRKYQQASAVEGGTTEVSVGNSELYSYRFRTPAVFVANEYSDFHEIPPRGNHTVGVGGMICGDQNFHRDLPFRILITYSMCLPVPGRLRICRTSTPTQS